MTNKQPSWEETLTKIFVEITECHGCSYEKSAKDAIKLVSNLLSEVREEERQRLLEKIKEMRSGGISLEDDRVCKDIMENKGNELSHLHEAMYYKIRQFDEALSQIKELRQNEK